MTGEEAFNRVWPTVRGWQFGSGLETDAWAAFARLITDVRAEMPCYYSWTDELPDCDDANDQEDTCPPCEARAERDKAIGSVHA